MRPATLPIMCGIALAIMAGAGASHFASVKQMQTLASNLPSGSFEASDNPNTNTYSLIAELRRQNSSMQQNLSSTQKNLRSLRSANNPQPQTQEYPLIASDAESAELQKILRELVAINTDLRKQIAETNRDVMDLRFQVDTHSEQFRPLNTVEEQPVRALDAQYDTSIGVLPPLDLPPN